MDQTPRHLMQIKSVLELLGKKQFLTPPPPATTSHKRETSARRRAGRTTTADIDLYANAHAPSWGLRRTCGLVQN